MLHIRALSGEELDVLDLTSFHARLPAGMSAVRALKQHLHSMCGLSRFRQKLLFLNAHDKRKEDDNDFMVLDDETHAETRGSAGRTSKFLPSI